MNAKTLVLAALLGASLALTGTAHAAAGSAEQQQKQLTIGAAGHQDGQVQTVQGNKVTLKPYQESAGVAELKATGQTKVFAFVPNGLVSSSMSSAVLSPGANVRVYFKPAPKGTAPEIVAIQLLPTSEANELQQQQKNVK